MSAATTEHVSSSVQAREQASRPEQASSFKPVEQHKPISQRARDLLNRFVGFIRRPKPEPDTALQVLATAPLQEPEKAMENFPRDTTMPDRGDKTNLPVQLPNEANNSKAKVVDLSPENIQQSQKEYIVWRRSQSEGLARNHEGYAKAVEPGRANVFCHATTLKGATQILFSGLLKSARKILLEEGVLAHAPRNRVAKPTEAMIAGKTLSQMTPTEKKDALDYAKLYISGILGSAALGYTVEGDHRVIAREYNTDTQTAVIFPLQALKEKGLGFKSIFSSAVSEPEDISPESIERAQMRLKYLPVSATDVSEGKDVLEINLGEADGNKNLVPSEVDLRGGLLLVRENQIAGISQRLRQDLLAQGKSEQDIEASLNKIVSFSKDFLSVNEAVGWLSNSAVGQALIEEKTGVDIGRIPAAKLRPEATYIRDFIDEYEDQVDSNRRKLDRAKKELEERQSAASVIPDLDRYRYELKRQQDLRSEIEYYNGNIKYEIRLIAHLGEVVRGLTGKNNYFPEKKDLRNSQSAA